MFSFQEGDKDTNSEEYTIVEKTVLAGEKLIYSDFYYLTTIRCS